VSVRSYITGGGETGWVSGLLVVRKTGWLSALLIRCQVGSYIAVGGDLVGWTIPVTAYIYNLHH
jgi:hypothetical protein